MRNSVVFIAEENRTNNELFQLLNWRFNISYYGQPGGITAEELRTANPTIVVRNAGICLDWQKNA